MEFVGLRRVLRRYVPFELRLRVALVLRSIRDRRSGVSFAALRGGAEGFNYVVCSYWRPFIDYPGQEEAGAAKRRNQALLASVLDGIVVAPGEVFSVWKLAGRPTAADGYAPAAALKDRELRMETGGAVCLLSTVLYNIGLLGALEIVERHCHSIDQYGTERYFELGRDAAIEYGYLDLRLRNPHPFPVRLSIEVTDDGVVSSLHAPVEPDFEVEIDVDEPTVHPAPLQLVTAVAGMPRVIRTGTDGLEVTAHRSTIRKDRTDIERLPDSVHHAVATLTSAPAASANPETS